MLFDLDPVVCGVWSFLIRSSADDIRRLPLLQHGQSVDDLAVCKEARHLIGFWCNKGTAAPRKRLSAWAAGSPGQFWGERIRERVASQVDAISHWTITHGSYADISNTAATWFVDPPYEVQGKHYRCGSKGIDFPALGKWCRARQGQVIVCEQEGAKWLPFRSIGAFKSSRARPSHEVVWLK